MAAAWSRHISYKLHLVITQVTSLHSTRGFGIVMALRNSKVWTSFALKRDKISENAESLKRQKTLLFSFCSSFLLSLGGNRDGTTSDVGRLAVICW